MRKTAQRGDIMSYRLRLFLIMVVIGTIGLFVTPLGLPSALVACMRAIIGSLCLFLWIKIKGIKIEPDAIKHNLFFLLGTGLAMGFNWIFLFEAFKQASVSLGTIAYYMAPVLIVMTAPLFFKEPLTKGKIIMIVTAFIGMVMISLSASLLEGRVIVGLGYGLLAAILYASIMIMNKKMQGIKVLVKTAVQLGIAAIILVIYCLFNFEIGVWHFSFSQWWVLLTIGVVHTGFAYVVLFDAFDHLPSHTASLLTFVDPVTAIFLSVLLLGERLTLMQLFGAILILGATFFNEYQQFRHKENLVELDQERS